MYKAPRLAVSSHLTAKTCNKMIFRVLCIVAVCVLGASAQISVPGVCQDVTVVQNFDIPKYYGLWFEYQRYFAFYQINGACVTATYTDNMNGTLGVSNYQVNSETGVEDTILGYVTPVGENGEAKLIVSFPSAGVDGDYWVLGTDYTNYAVVWSCVQATPSASLQNAWLLTRERVPSEDTLAAAQVVIDANMLTPEFLITDHTNCPQ